MCSLISRYVGWFRIGGNARAARWSRAHLVCLCRDVQVQTSTGRLHSGGNNAFQTSARFVELGPPDANLRVRPPRSRWTIRQIIQYSGTYIKNESQGIQLTELVFFLPPSPSWNSNTSFSEHLEHQNFHRMNKRHQMLSWPKPCIIHILPTVGFKPGISVVRLSWALYHWRLRVELFSFWCLTPHWKLILNRNGNPYMAALMISTWKYNHPRMHSPHWQNQAVFPYKEAT